MIVIRNEKIIPFDVDDTLVMWPDQRCNECIMIIDPSDKSKNWVRPHTFHIDLLKKHVGRGYDVAVWSQNGYGWAEAVVKELGLENYVSLVLTKPLKHVDDLPCQEWMGQHLYFPEHKRV